MEYLGKYEIITEIGRGAMGAVYKARDPLIDRLVALKTITGGPSAQSNLLDRFYQEARSAGALQHPNIVTIYELGHEKNTPFIAMEYLEGESLDRLIEQHPILPLSVKLGYIVRVCDALAYAHQHNVVHRDVKPANVMVTKEGVVKVVDFGIARLTDMSMTQPNMMIGSRAYMSPQLYKGERADARSDIWAVGVTLYELLAYKRPFTGESEAELMFHIIYEDPDALQVVAPDCPAELIPIIGKMLAKKAEDRYQSMDEVLHALEPIWKTAQQSTVAGLLADCEQLVLVNDMQRAQALLRKALHIDVGNTQAKTMLERVSAELRRTEILPRLKEHLSRGQQFLQAGQFREARAEAEAALGLDSKHEPAKALITEVEAAAARAQQLEQKLRLTKQRLAEGALTEAAAALGQALELDSTNAQAQELKRQIEEEEGRREKRKKVSEALHRARTLWTELNYDECLDLLASILNEYPNEPELLKLQATARADQAEQQRQLQMAEVRKLLGQQKFTEARAVLEVLAREYPQNAAVKNLHALALQEEQAHQQQKRLAEELAALRGLLAAGKYSEVTAKGEPLLRDYPQEFELRELVAYARGEVTRHEQSKKELALEKEIRALLQSERFREAEDAARRAIQEFPAHELFLELAAEAESRRKDEAARDRSRQEMQRRIQEINSKINQDKITDAIDLAQQTMTSFGPDPNVTRLLQGAEDKKKVKEEQERQIAALRTLVDKGDQAAATQLFDRVMATQILQPSDPRAEELRSRISSLGRAKPKPEPTAAPPRAPAPADARRAAVAGGSNSVQAPPTNVGGDVPVPPTMIMSATHVLGPDAPVTRPVTHKDRPLPARPEFGRGDATGRGSVTASGATSVDRPAVRPGPLPSEPSAGPASSGSHAVPGPQQKFAVGFLTLEKFIALLRLPPVLAGLGFAVVLLISLGAWRWSVSASHPTALELQIKNHAEQLWQEHQLDQSEEAWRKLAQIKSPLQAEAIQQVNQIEQKRGDELRRFQDGENLLNNQKDFAGAQQAFQDVIQMNLWHSDDALRELAVAKAGSGVDDLHKQEQDHFNTAVQLYQSKDFDKARREFRAMLELNVPDSVLKSQAEGYLSKMRQSADDQKLYDTAVSDIKNENWTEAQDQLQEIIKRKGSLSGDARKQLASVTKALQVQNGFEQALRASDFRSAKAQADAGRAWPKTYDRLHKDLLAAQQQQLDAIRGSSQALESKGDTAGIQHLQDELHQFESRAEDPSVLQAGKELDKRLAESYTKAVERTGDKAAFDAAVRNFEQARARGDLNQLGHAVHQEFQKIANGNGIYREQAQLYVRTTIPAAIQALTKTEGKAVAPPISCGGGGQAAGVPSVSGALSCAQLDADAPVQWIGTPMVDFPDVAKQPGKLPYTLHLLVTVESNGNVKIDKEGDADKEFFKKAKDAAKHWKATVPKSHGKPVNVRFPLTITFQR